MESLYQLTLAELVRGARERRWSSSDVVSACLRRIEELEPKVQAWVHLDVDGSRKRGRVLDGSEHAGALHAAPVAIKDIIDVAGMPTRYGSPIYGAAPAATGSAECVEALERAGAIVIGKSVTTEFAYYTPGKTRNPWNPAHTPGGSSMGSAASVACGMVAGALGTQTNGSVVRPAAFCGIVGFKPSLGTISNHGTLDPWPTLDHTGVFARNVADAALLASVVAHHGAVSPGVEVIKRAPRLALVRSPVWHLAEQAQRDMLESNAETFGRAGAQVDKLELPPPFEEAHRVHALILAYEGFRFFGDLQRHHRGAMSDRFNALLDEGASISERDYVAALAETQRLRELFGQMVAGYDALITPPAAGEAPATLEQTGSPAFCSIWTLLGVPAIAIPVGLGPAGLPLGLQLVGAEREDDRALGVAAWCESHLPFPGLHLQ